MDTPTAVVDYDRSGRHLTAYLSGELDETCAPQLTDDILRHIHPDDEVVWLDLSAITFCAAAGLTMFVRVHLHVAGNGGRLTLYHPTCTLHRVLELCCLDQALSIWPDPERLAASSASGASAPRAGSNGVAAVDPVLDLRDGRLTSTN